MDVLAHVLWAAAAAKTINSKIKETHKLKRLSVFWSGFWGVFPDLFAFTPLFVILLINFIFRSSWSHFNPATFESLPLADFSHYLYRISHSLVIFALVFIASWITTRRPRWELLGWMLHILIDIPSHSAEFFPTPFLWPVSNVKVNGLPWANPWFMLINYTALVAAYFILWWFNRRKKVLGGNIESNP